uniref:EF-hand domain-containing protein n=1 Tax=Biomphalaria glabrata TaxID=6526 RepID=A0A2C9LU17_BIOGL
MSGDGGGQGSNLGPSRRPTTTRPASRLDQENQKLENINLSQNSISLSGGLVIGRVLGQTANLKVVNLSWNHIRGGGAVGVCNSLLTNKSIEDLDLSWNGIGFEGCLALGESLRANRTLRRLNLENNRINWDCAPYISKSLNVNTTLEILELGLNPISMEGCEEILTAVCKISSKVQYISLAGIPINTKIALIATDIAKLRQFNLIHGGIFSSKDVLGIQRVQQEDPFSLLVRYMSTMGIRVMDLFRIFDKDNKLCVSRERFIQGLKRVRVPLDDKDIMTVAKRLQLNKRGNISYQELATLVRNRIREDRLEDKRQEIIQRKKREERKRILQSDKPLNAPSHFNFMPNLYSMYDPSERDSQQNLFTPGSASFSRAGSIYTPLPPIKGGRSSATDEVSRGRKTPMTLVRQNASLRGVQSPSIKSITKMTNYSSFDKQEPEGLRGVSYVSQIKWHQAAHELFKRRQSFL